VEKRMKKMKLYILLFIVFIILALSLSKVNENQSIKIEDKNAYAAQINKKEQVLINK
jgi:hypothetical protein